MMNATGSMSTHGLAWATGSAAVDLETLTRQTASVLAEAKRRLDAAEALAAFGIAAGDVKVE